MNFFDISRWGHGKIELVPDFCGNVLCDVPSTRWTNVFYCILVIWLCHRFLPPQPFSHRFFFSNFSDFRQPQIQTWKKKYYEILTTNTETHLYPIRKLQVHILNLSITRLCILQKNPITFEQGCSWKGAWMSQVVPYLRHVTCESKCIIVFKKRHAQVTMSW